MAQVTMDIAELDKLRSDIRIEKELVEQTKKKLTDLETEVALVKADKRVVLKRELYSPENYTVELDKNELGYILRNSNSLNNPISYNRISIHVDKSTRSIKVTPNISLNEKKESVEFVHFEDVKIELRKELEQQYRNELSEARSIKELFNQKLTDSTQNYRDTIDSLKKKYEKEVEELNKKIIEIQTNKIEVTEREAMAKEIDKLEKALLKERSKKWYHKLFNL